jgi:hypothetical protein
VSRRAAPELPAPSLWDEEDGPCLLAGYFSYAAGVELPVSLCSYRAERDRALEALLPARVPRRFWRSIQ